MILTQEQAIEVQNWYSVGGAMCTDCGINNIWSQTLILDNGIIVYVRGVNSEITSVFMSDDTGAWPMAHSEFYSLDQLYSKNARKRAPFA